MIPGVRPYPAYKDSGLSWAPRIPAHWTVARNGRLFAQRNETGFSDLPILEVSINTGVRIRSLDPATARKQRLANSAKYKRTVQGDIAYNMMRMWQGAVGVAPATGLVSPAYVVARPFDLANAQYFVHLFRTEAYKQQVNDASRGIVPDRNRLYWLDFKQLPSLTPPEEEQAAIVGFLHWANTRFDHAVRAKRKTIALINEQKQAIIHRAVTRGLDASIPLKPSGLPWLGEIPQHWEIISVRMRYRVDLGKMLDAKLITGRYLVPYLRNRDVQWDRILTENLPEMDISPGETERYTLRLGDLLVCEGGQVGRSAFWEGNLPVCGFQKALHRVRCINSTRDYPRFLFYQLQLAAALEVFSSDGNETTFAHLTCEKLRRHPFVFPPLTEQRAIADLLDSELIRFSKSTGALQREIALLREYRARLISDVVTGKLDVREAAAKLPDEAPAETTEPDIDPTGETEAEEAVA